LSAPFVLQARKRSENRKDAIFPQSFNLEIKPFLLLSASFRAVDFTGRPPFFLRSADTVNMDVIRKLAATWNQAKDMPNGFDMERD
jgi:hypothetical protein